LSAKCQQVVNLLGSFTRYASVLKWILSSKLRSAYYPLDRLPGRASEGTRIRGRQDCANFQANAQQNH
jgi:hypothetical protein